MRPQGCESRCPACPHRDLSANESEDRKSAWLSRALARWSDRIEPIRAVAGERRWGYRGKTVLFAQIGESGAWEFGMRISTGRWGEFDFIPIPLCPVHSPRVREVLALFSEILPRDLPLAFIAVSGAIVTLVLKQQVDETAELGSRMALHESRLSQAEVKGVFVNFNASAGQRVFLGHWTARSWKKIWGEATALAPSGLRHGPQSFQQLIPELYQNALEEARQWLEPSADTHILDLYSGVGASLALWQAAGARALGVELLGEAVEIGRERFSHDSEDSGVSYLQGRVSERLPQIGEWLKARTNVFVNPPRTGMESEVVDWLASRAKPQRIAYLSCSAGTLAKDLLKLEAKLEDRAYRVKRIIPYDFFPQTQHVESLALLELGVPVDSADRGSECRTQ
jgi:23S rRNA (uracil1939-C5)-methyltransferase